MRIMIIDRDPLSIKLMTSKLEQAGHEVRHDDSKQRGVKAAMEGKFDCIFVDPAPLTDVRPVVLEIWRALDKDQDRPYVVMLSKNAKREDAISRGCNDLLLKPLDHEALETVMGNAARLNAYCKTFREKENVLTPDSALGVLGKKAFQQLFLASIDRGFRYGERNCVMFIKIKNFDDILKNSGKEAALEALDKLADKISWIRRQSDVVGHIATDTFGILLQRPLYETEVFDAFSRFREKIGEFTATLPDDRKLDIGLSVIEMPYGALVCQDGDTRFGKSENKSESA
ncbi:MAG: response regulator [Micavibrio sp.]|nr:MAG: response regulator [Micavibrio sp.]